MLKLVATDTRGARITSLAYNTHILFIECVFLHGDTVRAPTRFHLTARQAGTLARAAGVKHLEPLHFSPRYSGDPEALRREAEATFSGNSAQ